MRHFRYIINETKREYYDRERTANDFWRDSRVDPLSVLLGTSCGHLLVKAESCRIPLVTFEHIVRTASGSGMTYTRLTVHRAT